MKKLDYNHLTTGALTVDASHLIGVVNDLIDLVNSQQEAIGELQTEIGVLRNMVLQSQEAIEELQEHVDHEARHVSEPADDKAEYKLPGTEEVIEKLDRATLRPNLVDSIPSDTHRTVTLRIPKGMRIGEAIETAWQRSNGPDVEDKWHMFEVLDTDLQKALDEVQPNE